MFMLKKQFFSVQQNSHTVGVPASTNPTCSEGAGWTTRGEGAGWTTCGAGWMTCGAGWMTCGEGAGWMTCGEGAGWQTCDTGADADSKYFGTEKKKNLFNIC